MERRRQGRIDLGPLLAYSRQDQEWRHRRPSLRFLSSLARRHRAAARDESEQLPLLRFLAAYSARRIRSCEFQRHRLLQPPRRCAARSPNSSLRYALSLGLAAVFGRCRGLAQSRYRFSLCRLRGTRCPRVGRPCFRLDAIQRTFRLHLSGLSRRSQRSRTQKHHRLPARVAYGESGAGRRVSSIKSNSPLRARGNRIQYVSLRTGDQLRRRQAGSGARSRPHRSCRAGRGSCSSRK